MSCSLEDLEKLRKFQNEESEQVYLIENFRKLEDVSNPFAKKSFGFKKNRKCNNAKRSKPRKKRR